jgi:hypothetical protein
MDTSVLESALEKVSALAKRDAGEAGSDLPGHLGPDQLAKLP